MALTRNDIPDNNYREYDVWGITAIDLYKWDGVSWKNWDNYNLGAQTLKDLLKQITGIQAEEKILEIRDQVATFNNGINREDLKSLTERIKTFILEDYQHKLELTSNLDQLMETWEKLSLVKNNFLEFLQVSKQVLADSQLTKIESDKILFALEKSISKTPPTEVNIPYHILFQDSLTSLVSDDKNTIWVGTAQNGLYRYDKTGWKRYGKNEGLQSEQITALGTLPEESHIWIATDMGLQKFDGKGFVISDFLIDGYQSTLAALSKKHEMVCALTIDPREQSMSSIGRL